MRKKKEQSVSENPMGILCELVSGATGTNIMVVDSMDGDKRSATILIPGGQNVSVTMRANKKTVRRLAAEKALEEFRSAMIYLPPTKRRSRNIESYGNW